MNWYERISELALEVFDYAGIESDLRYGIDLFEPEVFSYFLAQLLVEYISQKSQEDDLDEPARRELQSKVILAVNQLYDLAERETEDTDE